MRQAFPSCDPAIDTALSVEDFDEGPAYLIERRTGTRNWLIFATHGGGGRIGHAQGWLTLRPGSLAAIVEGTPHRYGTDPDCRRWRFAWTHCKPEAAWLPLLAWPEVAPGIRRLPDPDPVLHGRIVGALQEAADLLVGPYQQRLGLARNAVHRALLWCGEALAPREVDPRLQAVMDHVRRHLDRPLRLDGLAAVAGLSPCRFSRVFAAAVGLPPLRWVEQQRLSQAAAELQSGSLAVAAIAARVGYGDAYHFSRRFRAWSGHSPSAWRSLVVRR
jgi:AraC family transcriptional regulator of arabinose operon